MSDAQTTYERTCRGCGQPFTTTMPQQVYCGPECQRQAKRNQRFYDLVHLPTGASQIMIRGVIGAFVGLLVGLAFADQIYLFILDLEIEAQLPDLLTVVGLLVGAWVGIGGRTLRETLFWAGVGAVLGRLLGLFADTGLALAGMLLGLRVGWGWAVTRQRPSHWLINQFYDGMLPASRQVRRVDEDWGGRATLLLALERSLDGALFGALFGTLVMMYLMQLDSLLYGALLSTLVGWVIGGLVGGAVGLARYARRPRLR